MNDLLDEEKEIRKFLKQLKDKNLLMIRNLHFLIHVGVNLVFFMVSVKSIRIAWAILPLFVRLCLPPHTPS